MGNVKWVPNRNPQKNFQSSQAENMDAYVLILSALSSLSLSAFVCFSLSLMFLFFPGFPRFV